jgi:hypothetical protein
MSSSASATRGRAKSRPGCRWILQPRAAYTRRWSSATARIFVEFSLLQPHSLATASAGALIAASHGGEWTGEARPALIKFGIERPIRPMRLARPLEIGGFALPALHVRTGDHRGNFQLPPDAAPPPSSEAGQDPDEIVVTGNVRAPAPAST